MTVSRLTSLLLLSIFVFSACTNKPQNNNANSQSAQTNTPTVQASTSPTSAARVDRPQLVGLIKNVSIYPVPGQPGNTAVSLVVSVSNSGVPTSAAAWKLEVSSKKESFRTGIEPVHVNGVVEMPGSGSRTVDLGKEDLAIKALDTLVAPGTPLEGILTFVIPQTSERELSEGSTSFALNFKDKAGNSYQTARAVVGAKKK